MVVCFRDGLSARGCFSFPSSPPPNVYSVSYYAGVERCGVLRCRAIKGKRDPYGSSCCKPSDAVSWHTHSGRPRHISRTSRSWQIILKRGNVYQQGVMQRTPACLVGRPRPFNTCMCPAIIISLIGIDCGMRHYTRSGM